MALKQTIYSSLTLVVFASECNDQSDPSFSREILGIASVGRALLRKDAQTIDQNRLHEGGQRPK